jgi:hypothetical protein
MKAPAPARLWGFMHLKSEISHSLSASRASYSAFHRKPLAAFASHRHSHGMQTLSSLSAPDIERLARRRASAKLGWFIHAAVFTCVNALLIAISLASGKWQVDEHCELRQVVNGKWYSPELGNDLFRRSL